MSSLLNLLSGFSGLGKTLGLTGFGGGAVAPLARRSPLTAGAGIGVGVTIRLGGLTDPAELERDRAGAGGVTPRVPAKLAAADGDFSIRNPRFSSPNFSKSARALLNRAKWLSVRTPVTSLPRTSSSSLEGIPWNMFAIFETLVPECLFLHSSILAGYARFNPTG